jgi:hypothetical protein
MAHSSLIPVPLRFIAGDSFAVAVALPNHPESEGWAASLIFSRAGYRLDLTGIATGDEWGFSISPAGTASLAAGRYVWALVVTHAADEKRATLDAGQMDVLPDPARATTDPRTHARKVLDAIEAFLESNDYAASRTRVGDRELQTIPLPELLTLRDKYRAEVRSEDVAAGFRKPGRILVRF